MITQPAASYQRKITNSMAEKDSQGIESIAGGWANSWKGISWRREEELREECCCRDDETWRWEKAMRQQMNLPVAQHRLLPLPPSPFDSIQRSQSMPRGANLLPEPHLNRSLPTSKSTEFRKMMAHSRIKRAETVETYTLSKEDFEVPEVKVPKQCS